MKAAVFHKVGSPLTIEDVAISTPLHWCPCIFDVRSTPGFLVLPDSDRTTENQPPPPQPPPQPPPPPQLLPLEHEEEPDEHPPEVPPMPL